MPRLVSGRSLIFGFALLYVSIFYPLEVIIVTLQLVLQVLQTNLILGIYCKSLSMMWPQTLVRWWATSAANSPGRPCCHQSTVSSPAVVWSVRSPCWVPWWDCWSRDFVGHGITNLLVSLWCDQGLSLFWRDTETKAMYAVGMHKAGQAGMFAGSHLPAPRNLRYWASSSQGGTFVFSRMPLIGFSSINLVLHDITHIKKKKINSSNKSQKHHKK